MRQRIAVVDYGMGNLHSVSKALRHVCDRHTEVVVTNAAAVIDSADRCVLPGQGSMRDCIVELDRRGLREVLIKTAAERPFLGICMGMQVLLERSEEHYASQGFGVIRGPVVRFKATPAGAGKPLNIPHMGWNRVTQHRAHPLWQGINDDARFYFVHSFYVAPEDSAACCGVTDYGTVFASAIAAGPMFAVQFHPEKSQRDGLRLLANFARWDGRPTSI